MLNWLMAVVALTGTIMNIKKYSFCFILWAVSNTYWIIFNIISAQYPQALLYTVNLITAIWGWIAWNKNKGKQKKVKLKAIKEPA